MGPYLKALTSNSRIMIVWLDYYPKPCRKSTPTYTRFQPVRAQIK